MSAVDEELTGSIVKDVVEAMPFMKKAGPVDRVIYTEGDDYEALRAVTRDYSQSITRHNSGIVEIVEQTKNVSNRTIIDPRGDVVTDRGRWNPVENKHEAGQPTILPETLASLAKLLASAQVPAVF